jgi:hypothetical protein
MDGTIVQEELGESQWLRALELQRGLDTYTTLWRAEIWLTDYPVNGKALPEEMVLVDSWESPIRPAAKLVVRFLTWIHKRI